MASISLGMNIGGAMTPLLIVDADGPFRLARRVALDRAAGGAFDGALGLVRT